MEQFVDLIHQPNWKILLYDLVKSNEIDIWNVDLIKLTDLYLQKIRDLKEQNLLLPANALLAAAILLKLKANTLRITTVNDEEEEPLKQVGDDFVLSGAIDLNNPYRLKEGQVSLNDLIDVVETLINKPVKRTLDKKVREKINFEIPLQKKDITQRIDEFYSELKTLVDTNNLVLFSKCLNGNNNNVEIVENYFLPLLYLANDDKIDIWQEEIFQEIFIKVK